MRVTVVFAALFLAACANKPLEHFYPVPDFQLITQTGKPFDRPSLAGHVWVADFVFTNCDGPCPLMTSKMRAIQDKTAADVKLVSFTVDPARDTPEALQKYAWRYKPDTTRWSFLTGDPAVLNTLHHDVFKLGSGMDHSTRFVLVDKKGVIRGYYGISEGDAVGRVAKDAAALDKEPA